MPKISKEFEIKMIRDLDLTIALTVANMSLMRIQITSSRRYMIQYDFKFVEYLLKFNKISNKKNSTLVYVGLCGRI
jgi:hypothetical protein